MNVNASIEDLGYNSKIEQLRKANNLEDFDIGRIVAEHKERYIVKTSNQVYEAEITGNLRFSAKSREDFPVVGDWVALITYDASSAIIHSILPRYSMLSRQAVGKHGEKQIIATNIDYALIVQSTDRDFNINRIERYLTICHSSKVIPVIILTKTDLIDKEKLDEITVSIQHRVKNIPLLTISNETKKGYNSLIKLIEKGKTYCMLGSSGVGKSSIANNLSGYTKMKTGSISDSTNKGRHVTSHRELFILPEGGILIDNPGMREIGIVDPADGLETTFDDISNLSQYCKFKNCTHTNETDCAIIDALNNNEIDDQAYNNFLKMEKEKEHYERSVSEKRKKDKAFGKMIKNIKNDMQKISSKHENRYKK